MTTYGNFTAASFEAAADLSSHQFKIVKLTADGKVNLANADNQQSLGILQNSPQAGEAAAVLRTPGAETRVIAGGAVASAGLFLASDANGLAVVATSGECVWGVALQTAAGSGKIIRAEFVGSLPNAVLA